MENNDTNVAKKFSFREFGTKYGFYLGILIIILITVLVVSSDRKMTYRGSLSYDQTVYYVSNNMLLLKQHNNERVIISRNLLNTWSDSDANMVLPGIQISQDQRYVYFVENIDLVQSTFFGDLYLYHDGKRELISENAVIDYTVSDDMQTVLFLEVEFFETGKIYNLYKYDKAAGKTLIDTNVDSVCYVLSGDGSTVVYHKDFINEKFTASMYVHKGGEPVLVADNAYFHGKYKPSGTYRMNWPLVNGDGSRIVYVVITEDNYMLDAYVYENNQPVKIGQQVTQIFGDDALSKVLMIENASIETKTGTMVRIDMSTREKQVVAENVWGLTEVYTGKISDIGFINNNLYFKNYIEELNVADVYLKNNGQETLLLSKVDVSKLLFSEDYKTLIGLEYYATDVGGAISKVTLKEDGSFVKTDFDDDVKDVVLSKEGTHIAYVSYGTLFLVDGNNKKQLVDRDVYNFDFTDDEKKLFYFKRNNLSGDIKVKFLNDNKSPVAIAEDVTTVWDFGEGKIAFLAFYDFARNSGAMVITDSMGKYQIIDENVNVHLFLNIVR